MYTSKRLFFLKTLNFNYQNESSLFLKAPSAVEKVLPAFVTILCENLRYSNGSKSRYFTNFHPNNNDLTLHNGLARKSCLKTVSGFFKRFTSQYNCVKMSDKVEAMAQLENNSQVADDLIQEVYSKLDLLQKFNPELGVEVQNLLSQNEKLKQEVDKWKEMLILQQIRNGGNPVVRDAKLIERSAVIAAVKQEAPISDIKTEPASTEAKPESTPAPQQKGGKKAKKGTNAAPAEGGSKGGKPKPAGDAANAEGTDEIDIGRLDLRVGLIKECSRHPDADALYVEKIDVGEPNLRTVISGLVKHVPLEAMQNRMVVVLCNLKPSKMRGIMSEAMVMCASSPEKVEIMIPPSGSAPGDVIEVEGFTRRPDAVMNPKKKIFETVAPDLKTNDSKQATYKGVIWTVPGKGFVVSETLSNVNIK